MFDNGIIRHELSGAGVAGDCTTLSFQTTMNGLALFNTKTPFSAYQKSLSEFNGSQPL